MGNCIGILWHVKNRFWFHMLTTYLRFRKKAMNDQTCFFYMVAKRGHQKPPQGAMVTVDGLTPLSGRKIPIIKQIHQKTDSMTLIGGQVSFLSKYMLINRQSHKIHLRVRKIINPVKGKLPDW